MKKCLFTAALLFSCTLAFNQTRLSLSGVVKDETGEPLLAATVKLMNGENTLVRGVLTDLDGNFAFQAVEPGTYHLEVSYTGYKTKRVEKVAIRYGMVRTVDIVLEAPVYCCCDLIHRAYYPMLLDQNPGNTGTTYSASFFRHMY